MTIREFFKALESEGITLRIVGHGLIRSTESEWICPIQALHAAHFKTRFTPSVWKCAEALELGNRDTWHIAFAADTPLPTLTEENKAIRRKLLRFVEGGER